MDRNNLKNDVMRRILAWIVLSIWTISFFCCSTTKKNIATKDISVTILQTLQNEQLYFTIVKADSLLALQVKQTSKVESNLDSIIEKLAPKKSKDEDANTMAQYQKNHPLSGILFPFIEKLPNGEYTLTQSSFIGYSEIADTIKVNKYLLNPYVKSLFPKNIKYKWTKSLYLTDIYNLSAFSDSCKSFNMDSSSIENLTIKKSGHFDKSPIFKVVGAILDTTEFDIYITLKQESVKKITELSNNSAVLLSIKLCDKKYYNSVISDNLENEILIGSALSQRTINSIKVNYSRFIKK